MELTDWTAGIDKQTEENNYKSSPEGQLAFKTGQANLARIQGEVRGQQLDFQAKETAAKAQQAYLAKIAQMQGQQKAQAEAPAREDSNIQYLQQSIDQDVEHAKILRSVGLMDQADAIDKNVLMNTERLQKLQDAPIARLEKQQNMIKNWSADIEKAAGGAGKSREGFALYVKTVSSIKDQADKAGIKDPALDALMQMDPRDPRNLDAIYRLVASAKEKIAMNEQGLAKKKIDGVIDARTGLLTQKADASQAEASVNKKVADKRMSDNGLEEDVKIDVEKLWGPDWKNLSDDKKTLVKNTIGKNYRQVEASTNRAMSTDDIKKLVVSSTKADIGKLDGAQQRAVDALKTPEMLAKDKEDRERHKEKGVTRGRPAETAQDQAAVDMAKGNVSENNLSISNPSFVKASEDARQAASIAHKGNEKPDVSAESIRQTALRWFNGDISEADALKGTVGTKAAIQESYDYLIKTNGEPKEYVKMTASQRTQTSKMINAMGSTIDLLESMKELPKDARTGALPFVGNKDGLMSFLESAGARKISPDAANYLTTITAGFGRDLAQIEGQGVATGLVGMADQLQKAVGFSTNDSNMAVAGKMAEIRRIAESHIKPLIDQGILKGDQKKAAENLLSKLSKVIPYTTKDVAKAIAGGTQTIGEATGKAIGAKSGIDSNNPLLK